MTDREKLIDLYNQLRDIKLPEMDNQKLQVIVNTISEGLKIMIDWLIDYAKEHFKKS